MDGEKYHIGICDDETYWQQEIYRYCKLAAIKQQRTLEYHIFSSGKELLDFSEHIDILLLDEEMDGISGQQIKEIFESTNKNTMIIFVTSHNEIIYDSFGKNVYGFLTKPIVEEKFYKLFEKLFSKLDTKQYVYLPNSLNGKNTILCTDIMYIEANGSYSTFFLSNGEKSVVRKGITEIDDAIHYKNIARVHKSYIVNFDFAKKILSNNRIVLENSIEVPIARRRKKEVQKIFFETSLERANYIWNF